MLMMLTNFLYGIFEGFWRRWFGGGWKNKLPTNRFLQHAIGFLVGSLVLIVNGYGYIQTVLAMLVFQGLYWARAHGEFFDYGHSNPPDITRYDKEWWWKYIKKIMPESLWYTFTCDFICMVVRYTLPAILISIILLSFAPLMMGIMVGCVYALMWCFHDWYGFKTPTATAELIVGFFSGLLLLS